MFKKILLLLVFILIHSVSLAKVKILSIDGGGIRGIIPLVVLQDIESRLGGKRIAECFDVMSGTSTGGIIVAMLNVRGQDGRPKYTVDDILKLYETFGDEVFKPSIFFKFTNLFSSKYANEPLQKKMLEYLGDVELKDTVTSIIIPAYELEMKQVIFFKTAKAKKRSERNYYLRDIALATSSAPTYFSPANILNVIGTESLLLVDGGVGVNNPTISATVYAVEIFPKAKDFLVVSLGTGTNFKKNKVKHNNGNGILNWSTKIVSTLMQATNDVTDYQMQYVLNNGKAYKEYLRFQSYIEDKHSDMDNVTKDNIEALKEYGRNLTIEYTQEIQYIVDSVKK